MTEDLHIVSHTVQETVQFNVFDHLSAQYKQPQRTHVCLLKLNKNCALSEVNHAFVEAG